MSEDVNAFDAPGPEARYAAFLADGRFMLQRSRSSGVFYFPPRSIEPCSGARDLEWVEVSGMGSVYSTTQVARRPEQGGPYNVSLIELEEGPRMMSRVVDVPPGDVEIGMRVAARIVEIDGVHAVEFVPAGGKAA